MIKMNYLMNELQEVGCILYISFSKRFVVDDEVFSKHLPGRSQLGCHKTKGGRVSGKE